MIADLLTEVGIEGSVTTLSAPGKAVGVFNINVGSTTNWPASGKTVFFGMRTINPSAITTANPSGQVAGTYSSWKGIVGTNAITSMQLQTGSTDQVYAAGSNTQVFIQVSPARENALVSWGSAQHNLDGTHSAITATSLTTTGGITDAGNSLSSIRNDIISNYVVSGGVVATVSGLTVSVSNIIYYINGSRLIKNGIANITLTASQDAYLDIDTAGAVTVTYVANAAVSPALAANRIRIAKVITAAAAVTTITQSGVDSNYKPIDPASILNLASNMFGQSVQSYTNTGAGGGTGYYLNLGGIKLYWGTTGVISNIGANSTTSSQIVSLPPSFFTTIQSSQLWVSSVIASALQYASGNTTTTSQINYYITNSSAGTVSSNVSWLVIGT